jgi:hypothetical protein
LLRLRALRCLALRGRRRLRLGTALRRRRGCRGLWLRCRLRCTLHRRRGGLGLRLRAARFRAVFTAFLAAFLSPDFGLMLFHPSLLELPLLFATLSPRFRNEHRRRGGRRSDRCDDAR